MGRGSAHTVGVRYLSLDWMDAMSTAVAGNAELQAVAGTVTLGITQVVTDGPEGMVTYHLSLADGAAVFGPGAAVPEHVRLEQSWRTAVDVATRVVPAQEVFVKGLVTISGDARRLIGADPVFSALNAVFDAVRATTVYE